MTTHPLQSPAMSDRPPIHEPTSDRDHLLLAQRVYDDCRDISKQCTQIQIAYGLAREAAQSGNTERARAILQQLRDSSYRVERTANDIIQAAAIVANSMTETIIALPGVIASNDSLIEDLDDGLTRIAHGDRIVWSRPLSPPSGPQATAPNTPPSPEAPR